MTIVFVVAPKSKPPPSSSGILKAARSSSLVLMSSALLLPILLASTFLMSSLGIFFPVGYAAAANPSSTKSSATSSHHKSNYAVIVSSSRYWFNYRHAVNALSIYALLKDVGNYDDDHIVLMLADEFPSNSRNPLKNFLSAGGQKSKSLYSPDDIEIDYRGNDVTVENFVRVLTEVIPAQAGGGGGRRHRSDGMPILESDHRSNVLIYLTGHGECC